MGAKFLRKCLQTLPKKFSWFLFSWGAPTRSSDHTPIFRCQYTMSQYAMNVAWLKFLCFLFSLLPVVQRKFEPHENFPLYSIGMTVGITYAAVPNVHQHVSISAVPDTKSILEGCTYTFTVKLHVLLRATKNPQTLKS